MMKIRIKVSSARGWNVAFSIATVVMMLGVSATVGAQKDAERGGTETVLVGDLQRTYVVHLPKGYDATQQYPVMVLLHGAQQNADDMARISRFNELADKDSIIAVYPNAWHGDWNVGVRPEQPNRRQEGRRGGYGRRGGVIFGTPGGGGGGMGRRTGQPRGQDRQPRQTRGSEADDVAFLNEMLDKVTSKYAADKSRIYAAGFSAGGFMALRAGCTMTDRFAAVASVGAAMPKSMTCLPSRLMPVLMINGTSDPVVHYGGGSAGNGFSYPTLSAADSAKSWSKLDGCASKPSRTKIPARTKGGMRTQVDSYGGCRQGAQVVLYSIKGAGNTWPGGEQYASEKAVGKTTTDISADEVIWRFVVTHHLPSSAP